MKNLYLCGKFQITTITMKKHLFGALTLIAVLAVAGCGNQNQNKKAEEPVKEERMLIIVDPQID